MQIHEKLINYFTCYGNGFATSCKKDGKPFFKAYIELMLAKSFVSRLTQDKKLVEILSVINRILDNEALCKAFTELTRKDNRWLIHYVAYNVEEAGQIGHPLREKLLSWAKIQSFLGYDGTLFTQLEKAYLCQKLGLPIDKNFIKEATKITLEVTLGELKNHISRDAVYILTHIVFYLTDFGLKKFPLVILSNKDYEILRCEILRLIPIILKTGHFDIYAELGMCALFLGEFSVAREVLRVLGATYDTGWKGHRDLEKCDETDTHFFQTYHTTLVVCMLYYGYEALCTSDKIEKKVLKNAEIITDLKLLSFGVEECFDFKSSIFPSLDIIKYWHNILQGKSMDEYFNLQNEASKIWCTVFEVYNQKKDEIICSVEMESWLQNECIRSGHSYTERLFLNLFAELLGVSYKDPFGQILIQWFCESENNRSSLPKLSYDFFPIMWIYRISWISLEISMRNKHKKLPLFAYTVFKNANPMAWLEQKWKVTNKETQNVLEELSSFNLATIAIKEKLHGGTSNESFQKI